MWPTASSLAQRAARFLLGQRCQVCGQVLGPDADIPLCLACFKLLPLRQGGYCPCCGQFYADASVRPYACLSCRTSPPPWTRLVFYGAYAGMLQELVHHHKFGQDLGLESLLRFLLIRAWEEHGLQQPDILVPVPMRPRPVLRRGFNQSVELARILSQEIQVPLGRQVLIKNRDTQVQSTLGKKARLSNVRGAFAVQAAVRGQRVLLVDDVITTGATLKACAKACLQAGAREVEVLVLARAL